MPQRVKTVHDVGASQGLLINNPAEDEARAKEASSRADQALRAQLAAQAVAMSNPSRTVSGSPNGGGSETAAMGHAISNPWLRQERQKGKSEEAVRFQQGRADQQNAFDSQQNLQRQGLAQQFAAMQQDAMLRQFDSAQRGQLAREGMGLQREEMTQKGGQFDRTMSQQQGMFDAGQTLQREDMAQRGGQFKQSMQADLGKFMASLQEQTAGRRSSENQALRSRMDEILGPAMQFISTGQPLPESEVTRMSLEGRRDPRVAAELDRFLSSPTLYDATTSRQNRREDYGDIVGPIDVASMLPWALGFTDSPEDERMNALRNLGRASGRTQGTIGDFFDGPRPPQQPANQGLDMSNPFVAALAKIFEGR